MRSLRFVAGLLCVASILRAAETPQPRFRTVEIDKSIQIGYGVAVADVDGDRKPDILLADKNQFVWYRNPKWEKFVLAENLTKLDNVCIAARDIDGDGRAEIAVGAGWNPNDTTGSGALFYLDAPQDRTQPWKAIALPHVPTIHRIRWVDAPGGGFQLVSVPLHGYGNKNGEGEGVPIMSYTRPTYPGDAWRTNVIVQQWHKTHNFDNLGPNLWVAAKEGVFVVNRPGNADSRIFQVASNSVGGSGEVRTSRSRGRRFMAAIEPMHGSNVAVFVIPPPGQADTLWPRQVIDSSLQDGHALACADLLGIGRDQVVAGWRAMGNSQAKVGIKLYVPDNSLSKWTTTLVDDNGMACEDLTVADLNADGRLDIVAAGRGTKNVKIYFNETVIP
jgi:hypothetical protein